MGALNPLFLLAAAAAAVPLLLHILQRRTGRRAPFPALRYLQRVTREQARSVRLRQLLLLAVRVMAILLIVGGGARLYLDVRGGEHEPTALAIVVDNSMSSAAVQGEDRVIDLLRDAALESVERAGPDDRLWVFPAAEPWARALPADPARAGARIRDLEPTDAPARLGMTLERAAQAVAAAGLPGAEVHLYSDLQASALPPGGLEAGPAEVPVVARGPGGEPPPNRWVADVLVGGGLPPLDGEGTEVAVEVREDDPSGDGGGGPVPVRVEVDGELAGIQDVEPGGTAVIPVGPLPQGWVTGTAETDPDALRPDDRRHFAFQVREAPVVAVSGAVGEFAEEALNTLEAAGRIRLDPGDGAAPDVVLEAGEAAGERGRGGRVLLPPSDPARLPAFNRHLEDGRVPWEVAARDDPAGSVEVTEWPVPVAPEGVAVESPYRLEPRGEEPPAGPRAGRLVEGSTWMAMGEDGDGHPYLLLATPLDPDHTTLPVSPVMIPFMDWLAGGWAEGGGRRPLVTGDSLRVPESVTAVEDPSGTLHPTDGTPHFAETGKAGIYRLLEGDSVVEKVPANPPERESRLDRLDPATAEERLGAHAVVVESREEWEAAAFATRRGMELWRPLLLAAILLLIVEAWAASWGARRAPAQATGGTAAVPGAERQSGGS